MAISQGEMLLVEWPSNPLIQVCVSTFPEVHGLTNNKDMLTPIDQPLDKLADLQPDEMCVYALLSNLCVSLTVPSIFQREYERCDYLHE